MKVATVIVNYCTADLTLCALQSLMSELKAFPGSKVYIVDNDSNDGSYEQLKNAVEESSWTDQVEVIAAEKNGGFGYGNNVGINKALQLKDPPDYIYLLNSDASLRSGALSALTTFLDTHSQAGFAGSCLHDEEDQKQTTLFRFPNVFTEFEGTFRVGIISKLFPSWHICFPLSQEPQEVDWVSGASLMIRRQVFETITPFDETFFLYFEEIDLIHRAKKQGWSAYHVPESMVDHIKGASTNIKDHDKPCPLYWFFSRSYYFKKTHGRLYLWLTNIAWVTGFSLWRLRRWVQRKPDRDPKHMLWHFIRYNFWA